MHIYVFENFWEIEDFGGNKNYSTILFIRMHRFVYDRKYYEEIQKKLFFSKKSKRNILGSIF